MFRVVAIVLALGAGFAYMLDSRYTASVAQMTSSMLYYFHIR
jgi:hypothetical protein